MRLYKNNSISIWQHYVVENSICACLYVHVPSLELDFQRHMPWSFFLMLNKLKWYMIVRFVDIGGIVDHHCKKKSLKIPKE
jgi:hypothetical protein